MDLSRLSTEDLLALQANDLSKVSTKGLQELQRQLGGAEPTTAIGTAARELSLGALPAVGGRVGFGAGAAYGAPLAASLMKVPEVGPLLAGGVELASGIGGMFLGSGMAEKAQEVALGTLTEEERQKLGIDEESIRAGREQHNLASKAGQIAAMVGAGGFRPTSEMTLKNAVIGSGLGVGLDLAQQKLAGQEDTDWGSLAESALTGALLQKTTRSGQKLENLGRRLVGGEAIPYESLHPTVKPATEEEAGTETTTTAEAGAEAGAKTEVPPSAKVTPEAADRRATVMKAIDAGAGGVVTKASIRAITGLSDLEVQAELNALKNEGIIRYGGSRDGWVPTDRAAFDAAREKAKDIAAPQMEMFGKPPETPPEEVVSEKATEEPPTEEPPQQGVQYGFDLPGTPITTLTPRDRLLRAFKISKIHTFDELRRTAQVPILEAQEELAKLRNEGVVTLDESTGTYELTQTGEKRATDTGAEPTGTGGGTKLPSQQEPTGEPGATQLELGGLEPTGGPAAGAAGGEGKGEGALKGTAPRVDSIEGIPVGPGVVRPKVILEGSTLHHETNASGLTDLLRKDNDFDVNRVFVSDDPTLAIGQGDNTGVRVEFRPNSLSGAENPKPGTGVIGGREYVTDIIAPKAVEKVTVENPKTLGQISAQAKRVLSSEFERVDNPDGSVTFNRKPKTPAPAEAPKAEAAKPAEVPPVEAAKPAEAPKAEAKEEPKKEPEAVKEDVLKDDNPLDSKARYSKTPKEQQASDKRAVEKLGNAHNALPVVTQRVIDNTANALSNVPSNVRKAAYAFKNVHNLANMYRKFTGALDTLWDHMNENGAKLQARENVIRENLHKWNKVMSKYSPNERDRLYQIMHDTTVDQIEVLNYKDDAKGIDWKVSPSDTNSPIYKAFHAIKDQAVKDMYRDMRIAYHDYINEVEGEIKKYITPNEWQKLVAEYNMKRLSVYLPLFRSGDRFLRYVDKNNVDVARSFESERERNLAIKEAVAGGAKPDSVHIYNKLSDMTAGIPPTGFYGKMVGILKKNGVNQEVLDKLFESYMDHMPAKSVLQLARKREGTAGYINDPLRAYSNVAGGYARRLGNMEYFPKYDKALEQLKTDLLQSNMDPNVASDIISNVQAKVGFLKDQGPGGLLGKVADKAAYGSYLLHLGGNVSTGVVNLFDNPTMMVGRIAGIGGSMGDAASSLFKATGNYFNRANAPAEIKSILARAANEGVLGEHRISDLAEFKKYGSDYLGLKAKVDGILSYVLSKTDKFNREVALTAAYDVAKKKFAKEGLSGDALTDAAYKEAKRAVYDVHTSLYSQTMPNIMHNDLARTALTFKRYSINRINLLTDALREATAGESMQVKKLARAQLLGYFGMAYLVSGVQGMPLVGWMETLASATNGMFGDDDTPFDPEDALKHFVGEAAFHGPVNSLLNLDIASRTGWDGMLWRDDPKRLAEVGPAAYAVEHLLGPTYSYMVGVPQALKTIGEGHLDRGAEQLAPSTLRNFMKAWRYSTQGATTKDGVPIVKDVNAWNSFMQVWGFSPADITEARAEASSMKQGEREINLRRQALLDRAAITRMSQDTAGYRRVWQEIAEFNKKYPRDAIMPPSINASVMRRRQNMAQSVNGVTINQKLRSTIEKEHEED